MPCERRVFSANRFREHLVIPSSTWLENESVLLTVTPSTLIDWTHSKTGTTEGGITIFRLLLGAVITISTDFFRFSVKLFFIAQSSICCISSMAYTIMYWLVSSILVMECKILMRAAVVDPVGWNAYWSEKSRDGGACSSDGYMYSRVTMRFSILDNTGVIDIGRKSAGLTGVLHFGIGRMVDLFHCIGTTDISSERFIRSATGAAKEVLQLVETTTADCPIQWRSDAVYRERWTFETPIYGYYGSWLFDVWLTIDSITWNGSVMVVKHFRRDFWAASRICGWLAFGTEVPD